MSIDVQPGLPVGPRRLWAFNPSNRYPPIPVFRALRGFVRYHLANRILSPDNKEFAPADVRSPQTLHINSLQSWPSFPCLMHSLADTYQWTVSQKQIWSLIELLVFRFTLMGRTMQQLIRHKGDTSCLSHLTPCGLWWRNPHLRG